MDSKSIVQKCKDEGVPKIDTHMSPVSAGLAETIREWFHAGSLKTAVESTEHVNLEKAKKRRAPRARAPTRKRRRVREAGMEARRRRWKSPRP